MISLVKMTLLVTPLLLPLTGCGQAKGPAPVPPGIKAILSQDYVGNGNKRQMLDLYVPEGTAEKPRPLVVYIHGGGWHSGSKDNAAALFGLMKDRPYAGASVNYRLTDQASWPAQIHDCKAAIRWLRAHAKEHNIDPEKIAVFGISAGGHLVSMLGLTQGNKELEGTLGPNTDQSTQVTCVLDFCGPANFMTIASQGSSIDPNDPKSAIAKLVGGPLKDKQEVGRNASPVNHITSDDAPFLIIHGEQDTLVPYAQAKEMDAALEAAKIPATLVTGVGGKHVFYSVPLGVRMRDFLDRHLLGKEVEVPEAPVPAK
jgi:acetyl esterase/lipase